MRFRTLLRAYAVSMPLLAAAVIAGCAAAQASEAAVAGQPQSAGGLAGDTSLLGAVLRSLPRKEYHDLEFDPRVVKDDPNLVFVHPPDDFVASDSATVESRAGLIPRLNGKRLVGYDYFHCSTGPGGLGRADSAGLARRQSLRRPYCVIAGVPRQGGAYFPAGDIDRRSSAPRGAYTTRVITIDPGSHTVYDVVAAPGPTRGWTVVETVVLWRAYS